MSKILDMRQKRSDIWDKAKAFLDTHTAENGLMSAEDTAEYERMEQEVVDLGHAIEREERAAELEREMNAPVSPNLASRPEQQRETKKGVASDAYKDAFWKHMRDQERRNAELRNALQVGELSEGGYTVPDEFERTLVQALEEENIMRGLVHVITTSSGDRKIPLVTSKGAASWVEEEAAIPESDDAFGQITLSAHKVGSMIRISEELLHDSAFDLAAYITGEFARRVGAAEEEAIITGNGTHKPTGLLHATLGAETGVTAAAVAAITADELIDLQHSLKSGYRRKACWIMNDACVKLLRKLKDGNGQFLWQPGLLLGQPDTLLNQKVLTSNYMPLPAAGNKAILYGDYSYYWLADREGRSLQRLNELYAANDQVGFKITQRVDGRLILREAVKCLAMKTA
ncbi:MAG: phage major capsid protein [Eubacteriales bacterium]|nr:phage major capsid protein [Eubacteriales bacterium]MDD4513857.1 phage major capsid protein [Eubacteriales bacterium]